MDAYLIMDGQWGSSGKGLLAGKLALDRNPDLAVCNFGPNAGHTFITAGGTKLMTRQIPTALINPGTILVLGPGSVIDPKVLSAEILALDAAYDIRKRLLIHERAAVVMDQDLQAESDLRHIASTRKGVGAAQARKLMRSSTTLNPAIAADYFRQTDLAENLISASQYRSLLTQVRLIQIESAQGLELSLNHGSHYPYCTSRDITPEAVLNDVGIGHRHLMETDVVVRTFPIRVGNELEADGSLVGTSGPVYQDMRELSWAEISLLVGRQIEERTTVTGKIRRVFTWSHTQFERMLLSTGPCQIMLNFCNYLHPTAMQYQSLDPLGQSFIDEVNATAWQHGSEISWLGFGPAYGDVQDFTMMNSPPSGGLGEPLVAN